MCLSMLESVCESVHPRGFALSQSVTERNRVDAQMTFFSSDTNVLYLIIANYDRLQKNTSISMVSTVQ